MQVSAIKVWRRQKEIRQKVNKTGKVVTFTKIHSNPSSHSGSMPYFVALVELDSGERVFGQIVDSLPGEVKIGASVRSIVRISRQPDDEAVIPYGLKFEIV